MTIMGFAVNDQVASMIARVERLSPARPLPFGPIAASHHAAGGTEILSDRIQISVRPQLISNALLGHELGHAISGLEHAHLLIEDRIPRGTPDRRMVGTIISMFEHPAVYDLVSEYGFHIQAVMERKMSDYSAGMHKLPQERPANMYMEQMQGYVELKYLFPDDRRWISIDKEFAQRAPSSFDHARRITSNVITRERIESHAYKEMLNAFIRVLNLQAAYWPQFVPLASAARSDATRPEG